jgi:hypothetical protein
MQLRRLYLLAVVVTVSSILVGTPALSREPALDQSAPGRASLVGGYAAETAYFKFDYPPYPETFIFETSEPTIIQQARNILAGQQPNRIIIGTIVKTPSASNPAWSYHLDPATVAFAENAIEVCDATIRYVEEHLDEVGDALLPGGVWCPWGSRLLEEVSPSPTPPPALYLPIILSDPAP